MRISVKKIMSIVLALLVVIGTIQSPITTNAQDKVVYLNSGATGAADGSSPVNAFTTLDSAIEAVSTGGTIVLCGSVSIASAASTASAAAHTGEITITGKTQTEDYSDTAEIIFPARALSYSWGGAVTINNLTITSSKNLTFFAGDKLAIGDSVTTNKSGTLKIFGGSFTGNSGNTYISVLSGSYDTIMAGSSKGDVADAHIVIGGTAQAANVTLGSNSGECEDVSLTMNGGVISTLQTSPDKSHTASSINVDIQAGTLPNGLSDRGTSKINGNVSVKISANATVSGAYGVWNASVVDVTGSKKLTLWGYADIPTDVISPYDEIIIADESTASYSGTFTAGQNISIETGSKLILTGYENASQLPENVVIEGNVVYGNEEETYAEKLVVYVNGQASQSGDGLSADNAVKTLDEAYNILLGLKTADSNGVTEDTNATGKIIICGKVEQPGSFNLNSSYAHKGTILITSVDGETDYRTSGAVLNFGILDSTSKVSVQFAGPTVIDDITFNMQQQAAKTLMFYAGNSLTIGDGFDNYWQNQHFSGNTVQYAIRSGYADGQKYTADSPIEITVNGGTWRHINMGTDKHNTGDVTVSMGAGTVITSYIECGGVNSTNTGNMTVNVEDGAVVNALYLYTYIKEGGSSTTESLTVNNAGTIKKMMAQRSKLTGTAVIKGNMTVNVKGTGKITGTGSSFGLFNDTSYVQGKIIYNKENYTGTGIPLATQFNVMNLFGGSIPVDYDTAASGFTADKRILQINGYSDYLSLDLTSFDAIRIDGNSRVSYLDEFDNELPVYIGNGSRLILNKINNTSDNIPTDKSGDGSVVLEYAQYSGAEQVLHLDFDEKNAADDSGNNNNGTIHGSPEYVESYDGSNAIHLQNAFGKTASQYITFDAVEGINIGSDDFAVSFWYKSNYGGLNGGWQTSANATDAGEITDFSQETVGGIIFANKNYETPYNKGFAASNMIFYNYMTTNVTGADGTARDNNAISDSVDERWHQVTISYDRAGSCDVYVDNRLASSVDISAISEDVLVDDTIDGGAVLALGADVLGQYGVGDAYIDDFTIYNKAVNNVDVQALYSVNAIGKLCKDIDIRLETIGSEYEVAAINDIKAKNEAAKSLIGSAPETYTTVLAEYNELKKDYEEFLLSPEAKLSMILTSDVHVKDMGDMAYQNMQTVLSDPDELDIAIDGVISSGDFADNSTAGACDAAFASLEASSLIHPEWSYIIGIGNHEQTYTNNESNYTVAVDEYMNQNAKYMAAADAVNNYSYGITVKGYHFLVLNTDMLEQTSESDPIRHGEYYTEESMKWIEHMLETYAKDGLPIFVIQHPAFDGTVYLADFSEVPIEDNSVGRQNDEMAALFNKYPQITYMCGHLHHGLGMTNQVTKVYKEDGFTQINLPSLKGNARGYTGNTTTYYMFVYEDEIVLRARNFSTNEWLTDYDEVIKIAVKKNDSQSGDVNSPAGPSDNGNGSQRPDGNSQPGNNQPSGNDNGAGQLTDVGTGDELATGYIIMLMAAATATLFTAFKKRKVRKYE